MQEYTMPSPPSYESHFNEEKGDPSRNEIQDDADGKKNSSNASPSKREKKTFSKALKAILPVVKKPPNWFTWHMAVHFVHPDTVLYALDEAKRVASSCWAVLEISVRADVDVFELLREGIPWQDYLGKAKDSMHTQTHYAAQPFIHDVPRVLGRLDGKPKNSHVRERVLKFDGPSRYNELPRWSATISVRGHHQFVQDSLEVEVLIARETMYSIHMFDNTTRLEKDERTADRVLSCRTAENNKYTANSRVFTEEKAQETIGNLIKLVKRRETYRFGRNTMTLSGRYQGSESAKGSA